MYIKGKQHFYPALSIPEGQRGEYAIKHLDYPAGHTFSLANGRTAIMGGHRGAPVSFNYSTRWHQLSGPTGVWMTDLPIEQVQHDRELAPIRGGRVLVGGLGLGYAATILAQRLRVKEVVVVEISQEVIDLVADHMPPKIKIVQADLFEYLKTPTAGTFDWAFYDIWQSDGESTFFQTVLPLCRLSHERVRHEPICWNESVMRGQLYFSIQGRLLQVREAIPSNLSLDALCEPRENIWWDWTVPFFQWFRGARPSDIELEERMAFYARCYGRRMFPHLWRIFTGVTVPDLEWRDE